MCNRILWLSLIVCLAFAGSFAAAPAAQAQQQTQPPEPTLYTYVSFWGVPRPQWGDMQKDFEKNQRPVLEKLVAEGTLVSWGSASEIVHQADGMTHNDWFQSTSLAGIIKTLEAFSKLSAEDPIFANAKHFDLLMRTVVHGGKTATLKNGYLVVFFWHTKAGQGDAWLELFKKTYRPWLDESVANGSVTMYNVDAEQIHTNPPGMYAIAVVVPDEASLDKLYANIAAMAQKNPAIPPAIAEMTVGERHRDLLARVTSYQHK